MDGADERRGLIALHLVPALGPRRIAALIAALGSVEAAWRASRDALERVPGIGPTLALAIARARDRPGAESELRRAGAAGVRLVTWLDPDYPARLRGIPGAPPVLYVRGTWPGGGRAVAVVGTRRASAYGLGIAGTLGRRLARAGAVVISGLARGIDAAAHAGALEGDGPTVGVLGCGVDVVYPPEHRGLIEAMCRNGAVVSELPMGTRPRARQFPARNRLVSGLSDAVVVVEGDVDSGAMITARFGAAQGRAVFAVPGSVHARASRGPHRLLAGGARVLTDPADLLRALGLGPAGGPASLPAPDRAGSLEPVASRVLAVLGEDPLHVDAVAARAGVGPAAAAGALLVLELDGLVRELPGKRFVRVQTGR